MDIEFHHFMSASIGHEASTNRNYLQKLVQVRKRILYSGTTPGDLTYRRFLSSAHT